MKKLPKYPKGLKARLRKAENAAKREMEIKKRKAEIERDRKRLETLKNKAR